MRRNPPVRKSSSLKKPSHAQISRAVKHKKTETRKPRISGRVKTTCSSAATLVRKKFPVRRKLARVTGKHLEKELGKQPLKRSLAKISRSKVLLNSGRRGDGQKIDQGCGEKNLSNRKVGQNKDDDLIKLVRVGEVTHYFDKIKVCVVKVDGATLFLGDKIIIKGKGTELKQKAASLQVENFEVKAVKKGQLVGLKVDRCVREGDVLYKTRMR